VTHKVLSVRVDVDHGMRDRRLPLVAEAGGRDVLQGVEEVAEVQVLLERGYCRDRWGGAGSIVGLRSRVGGCDHEDK
jgi:hypothetical protein